MTNVVLIRVWRAYCRVSLSFLFDAASAVSCSVQVLLFLFGWTVCYSSALPLVHILFGSFLYLVYLVYLGGLNCCQFVESSCLSYLLVQSTSTPGAPGARRPRFSHGGGQALSGVDPQSGLDRWKLVQPEEEVRVCWF